MKKNILIIDSGGTISQKVDDSGVLSPSNDDFFAKTQDIYSVAEIDYQKVMRIDSSSMTLNDRKQIAQIIFDNKHYDGFVIIQGTDTMAYTASCLSYMLQNFYKPIVLTGAQKSIFSHGPDGINNCYYSVKAATMDIGEVVICFGDRIIRGNRSIKLNVVGFNAFKTPQIHSIAEIGSYVRLFEHRIKRNDNTKPELFLDFDNNIFFFHPISGFNNAKNLQLIMNNINFEGLIITGFGSANLSDDMLPIVKKLAKKMPVLVISSCPKGIAKIGAYKSGKDFIDAGVVSLIGITYESSTQKMMYALGVAKKMELKSKQLIDKVKQILLTPINKDIDFLED